jgi:hypothetical protein
MAKHQGSVTELNRKHVSKAGNECIYLKVGMRKYYLFEDLVPAEVKKGDGVEVEFEMDGSGKFAQVQSVKKIELPTSQEGSDPQTTMKKGETPTQEQPATNGNRDDVFLRQTSLNCASELIANKVFSTSTGAEGVCSLANEFVLYLKDGTMPKTIKQGTK